MAPPRVVEWLRKTYPKPTIDPEWLDACLGWISEELKLSDINSQADEIISNVDSQLLNSDLHDSMVSGTGFPHGIGTAENTCLRGCILVQIEGITDIGHSAFSLQNVQQTRLDRADLAGLVKEDEDEDEGPIPKYPRGMLRFDLTDGSNTLRAIEYRRLPELELGVTPLGFKMVLKDVPIRQGIAFLEPSNVVLKGYMTEELDVNREADFARGLRMRLGQQPVPEQDATNVPPPEPPGPLAPLEGLDAPLPLHAGNTPRTPLREVKVDDAVLRRPPHQLAREDLEPPTRRRVPATSASIASSSRTLMSPYFANTPSTSATITSSADLTSVRLSPVRRVPLPSSTLADRTSPAEDLSTFSDDITIDDAFLQELEAVERAALNTVHQRDRDNPQGLPRTQGTNVAEHSEVILIESDEDEDDKENLAPFSQRRVRPRMMTSEDSDVIEIE